MRDLDFSYISVASYAIMCVYYIQYAAYRFRARIWDGLQFGFTGWWYGLHVHHMDTTSANEFVGAQVQDFRRNPLTFSSGT